MSEDHNLDPDTESDADHGLELDPDSYSVPDADLPTDVAEETERLTHLAREAVDPGEREVHRERRAELAAEHGYAARVREEDTREVLVLYPTEWLDDGLVRTDRINDLDRAVERPLSGPGDPDDWAAVDAHNRSVAARVADARGPVHGANARAFADFMSNHYARPVESASNGEIEEFRAEYFPRNAWPTAEQKEAIDESIESVFDAASADPNPGPGPDPDSDLAPRGDGDDDPASGADDSPGDADTSDADRP